MKKRIISIVAVVLVVAMLSVVLVACAPKTVDDAKAKMEKKYDVVAPDLGILKLIGIDVEGAVGATLKEDANVGVTALMFTNKEDAEAVADKIKTKIYDKSMEQLDAEIKAEKDADKKADLEALKKASVFKQSGNWIVFGHKKAVNAFLGL